MAYGQVRVLLVDRIASAVASAARVARLAMWLATATRMRPSDVYAALMTARFMAAHELIERAEAACDGDESVELVEVRQPLWFGGAVIVEDDQ